MAKSEQRFTVLYEQHYDAVERYVRRRIDDAAVRDVVAEVFLVAWRRLPEVPADALPWLYGTARRVLANEVRGAGRRAALTVRAADHGELWAGDHADEVAGRVSLASALSGLSESDAEALRLVAWECLTLRQAARAAGCSLPAFAMRLHRARARLRQALSPAGPTRVTTLRGEPS
ncbi:RNA polymerase sigma factor [Actinoplanes sp. CA-252034]|uniref:RNA polymerase sigma factor n=1 Tax=Actinoplanes sp. CA-252034 TaxID=3239906 RepID=UPI003D96A351